MFSELLATVPEARKACEDALARVHGPGRQRVRKLAIINLAVGVGAGRSRGGVIAEWAGGTTLPAQGAGDLSEAGLPRKVDWKARADTPTRLKSAMEDEPVLRAMERRTFPLLPDCEDQFERAWSHWSHLRPLREIERSTSAPLILPPGIDTWTPVPPFRVRWPHARNTQEDYFLGSVLGRWGHPAVSEAYAVSTARLPLATPREVALWAIERMLPKAHAT